MADDQATAGSSRIELAVLGAALGDRGAWEVISQSLAADDFTSTTHGLLFEEISRADEEGRWDDTALIAQAVVDGGVEESEGYNLVANAAVAAAPLATLPQYIDRLRTSANARKAAALSHAFAQQAAAAGNDADALAELLGTYQDTLHDLEDRAAGVPWETAGDLLKKVEQGETHMEATLPTGFPDLDRILQGGFRPRQMVTVAGRPAMGKSTLAVDIGRYASLHRDIPGLYVSLEMSSDEVGMRIAAAEAAVPLSNLVTDTLSPAEHNKISEVREQIDGAPLSVLDAEDGSWGAVRGAITSAYRRNGIQYAVIDYLQLVTLETKKTTSRTEEVGAISRNIKLLAKQLGITIIAVAQLNRAVENRTGNVPQISDLRESGTIEQDSDVVTLVHRPDYYDATSPRMGEADIIIAKHRNGPTGTATLAFQGGYSRFASLAMDDGTRPTATYPKA